MDYKKPLIQPEQIEQAILLIRGHRVMLDRDLAALYGVTTGNLNKSVQRNPDRFPADFMLQLTDNETEDLLFQIGRPKQRGGKNVPAHATGHGFGLRANNAQPTGKWIERFEEWLADSGFLKRLFGELVLEGFEVSHTKDQILFDDGEQEALELKLKHELAGLRQLALSHRKDDDQRIKRATDAQRDEALNKLENEIQSDKLQDFFKTYEIPNNTLLKKSNELLKNSVVSKYKPDLKTKINKTTVSVYLVKDMSVNDPYVIIESTKSETSVIVIINLAHPHWSQLTKNESILNFIRHCTYDGVSESKAYFMTGKIEPDTVKLIKDNLLRIPMTLTGAV